MSNESPRGSAPTKLLVVDDEEIILSVATDVLEGEGYIIKTETNPLEALKRVSEESFDFVLTDINMPEMNGLEMVKQIKKIDANIGAIFMTGYANLETAKEAIKTGAYDYIMKPFELVELRAAVTKAVEKRREEMSKTEGARLDRLSDLVEVLYTVGDKKSLLRLSLGLALINSGLTTGFITCWESKSGALDLVWTDNVRESDFREMSAILSTDVAKDCFNFNTPLRTGDLAEHPFVNKLQHIVPESNSLIRYFDPEIGSTTLKVMRRDEFLMVLCIQNESSQALFADGDLKLLNLVLNMAMVVVENVLLLSESQAALAELATIHDQIVNLERVATQGIMSAEIGHELNNYLNIVQSNFELLKLKANITNSDDVDKYIRGINESLDQMTRFTIGLVDSAKLKSEKTKFDLDDLIEDIVAFLSPQKKYGMVKLIHNKSGNLPKMTADAQQLQQLFYNLLNNAAESFPEDFEGQRQITITTQLSGSDVKIDVVDNGSGIPESLQKTMFSDRFTTKTSGHGFGLLVCKKVVESHNGHISVESTEGEGTVFHITFPTSG